MASGGGDGNQQQHQADLDKPEAIWLKYIRENYPHLEQHTYFYPPLYFNRVRFAVDKVAGQRVLVTDPNHVPRASLTPPPVHKKKARAQPSTSSASAGTPSNASPSIFIENPPNLRPPNVQESDQRDDEAHCESLYFLDRISPEEPMVVISQLEFQNYLNIKANPNDRDDIQKLPAVPSDCRDGDWDVLIIHRHFGLIVGEVKAVGGSSEHTTPEAIQKRVKKALEQLEKEHKVLKCLVKDLTPPGGSGIRITRMLMLPNLTYGQVNAALSSLQEKQQELFQTLSNSNNLIQTRRHVLCQDDLLRDTQWWRDLHGQESDPCMTFDIYERLVARFCGRATTVKIPVACTSQRSELRTLPEAVAEVSLRYSFLTLTSSQVTLLCEMPDQQRVVYCQGPPGCGKSVVLLLKAMQWVQMEKKVVIISQPSGSAAVSMLIKHQLTKLVGQTAAAKYIRVHSIDFDDSLNVHDDVERLWNDHGLDCAILCDEVPIRNANNFVPWLTEVQGTSPQNQPMVWMAGVWSRDSRDGNISALLHLPPWVEVRPMCDPLRCPPAITEILQMSRLIGQYIGQYNQSTGPVLAQGFPVQRLRHFEEPGHCAGNNPLLCNQCTDAVAEILKSLGVGERGPLQYRDVGILTNGYHESNEPPMVQRLRNNHEMRVASIRGTTLGEADAEELALAQTNQIIETHFHTMRGLERKIVVSVATRMQDYEFESFSRSTCFLICID